MIRIEQREVATNGIHLNTAIAGDGPLMLCVHGFPDHAGTWRGLMQAFADTHTVAAPDMRGYRGSDKPEGVSAYKARQLVSDLGELASALGHERFTLVGHDWGGAVAWAFAIAFPERVDRLVILNAPHPGVFQHTLIADAAQNRASQYIRFFREAGAEVTIAANDFRWFWEKGFGLDALVRKGVISESDKAEYNAAWGVPGALTAMLNWYRASPLQVPPPEQVDPDYPPPSPVGLTVNVPTLALWGMRDPALLPCQLDGLSRYVPDLRVHPVPDAGHWVHREAPDAAIAAMREFLSPGDH